MIIIEKIIIISIIILKTTLQRDWVRYMIVRYHSNSYVISHLVEPRGVSNDGQ